MKYIAFIFIFVALFLCSCNNIKVNDTQSSDVQSEDTLRTITKETAFEGVNNYCHRESESRAKHTWTLPNVRVIDEVNNNNKTIEL
jgi:hypothetical protein